MTKKLLMCSGAVLFLLVILLSAGAIWISDFTATESELEQLRATRAQDISYIQNSLPATRGRILAVVTSARRLGDTGRPTGYELTELARAYWVFTANGFEVDIASPLGSEPYAVLDRSEEHTSELQSRENLVCRLPLAENNLAAPTPGKRP